MVNVYAEAYSAPANSPQPTIPAGYCNRQLRFIGIEPLQRAVRVVRIIQLTLRDGPAGWQVGTGSARAYSFRSTERRRRVRLFSEESSLRSISGCCCSGRLKGGHGICTAARIMMPLVSPPVKRFLSRAGSQQVHDVLTSSRRR